MTSNTNPEFGKDEDVSLRVTKKWDDTVDANAQKSVTVAPLNADGVELDSAVLGARGDRPWLHAGGFVSSA